MLNKVNLQGRLVKEVEVKATTSGTAVATFTLAVERNFKSGEKRQSDFINCVAWRNSAEFISKYFQKGQMMVISGSLQTRTWEDTQGNKKYATEVIVEEANFCGDGKTEKPKAPQGFENAGDDDDLPF